VSERGVIRNRAAAQQLRDFSGLRYGRITPTDIDAYMEFGGRLFIFVEAKFGGAALPRGQMLAMERLVDAVHMPPQRYAAAIVVGHETQGADVDFANAVVRVWRWSGKWRQPIERGITLRRAVNRLVAAYGTAEVFDLAVENDRRAAAQGTY
jgi:hypothetical protein